MYRILVCDDEKDIVSALKIYLASEGYEVVEAYNGEEALRRIGEQEIHLVLMDIMMPQMDGITAMVKIREISNVPVILLTAKGEDTDKVLGLTVGADDYVTKPFNPVELQARVKSQLRRYMMLGGGNVKRDILSVGGVEMDDKAKEVTLDGELVSHQDRIRYFKASFGTQGGSVFPQRDLPESVEGHCLWHGKYRGSPHPPLTGKIRV